MPPEDAYVAPGTRALPCEKHGSRMTATEKDHAPRYEERQQRGNSLWVAHPMLSWEGWELRPLAVIRAENAKELRHQLGIGEAVA